VSHDEDVLLVLDGTWEMWQLRCTVRGEMGSGAMDEGTESERTGRWHMRDITYCMVMA
jgi:hypothetical protein